MKTMLSLFAIPAAFGAAFVLSGCYTQLATSEDYEPDSYSESRNEGAEPDSILDRERDDDYWRYGPRTYYGFRFFYPWHYSFYWAGYDPWYGDPWHSSWYWDPWYYYPWHFPSHYYYRYNGFAYYSPWGYYYDNQPYIVNDGLYGRYYTRRESGYRRTGNVRDGYRGTGSYSSATSRLPDATRSNRSNNTTRDRVTSSRNRSTESGSTRSSTRSSGSYGRSRSNTPDKGTSRGRSYDSGRRESTRNSGSSRSGESRRESYSPPAPRSYSPPAQSSPPPSSRGSSGGGGSRSGGATRGNHR